MSANNSAAETTRVTFDQSARETVESIVVAVILAFLFRGFVAEAFVIPTGSMAPTLQGRHMDVICAECGHQYRTGASVENDEFGPPRGEVTRTRCPICRYPMTLDKEGDVNQRSFNGDRILVSKFAYQFQAPQRWDVIVFKYPGNAKINYIKRLVGLPGETLRIWHGDVYILDPATQGDSPERQRFRIERKPADKVLAMLQLVDDSRYVSRRMQEAGWPDRWVGLTSDGWQKSADGQFTIAPSESLQWLRYRHLPPGYNDWRIVGHGEPLHLDSNDAGQLITDYYEYNDTVSQYDGDSRCWVGDLALECEVEITGGEGEIRLDLVEGGQHFSCTLNTATGEAKLAIDDGAHNFTDADGHSAPQPAAHTKFRGHGEFSLRFANVDDQLHLWINESLVQFDSPTTFVPAAEAIPRWSEQDPGDLQPVGIASRGLAMHGRRLRILRDVYYRAVEASQFHDHDSEYETATIRSGDNIETVMSQPRSWSKTNLFAARRAVTFKLGPDQFFPLGDNSPQSRDARIWTNGSAGPPPYVERQLLIGKALAIYWPHGWRYRSDQVGFIPNYQRIGLIR